ncbi:MAG: hypothetical protein IT436_06225 [Phycisphaerales bacterium]|nr:hypothetical protein [Phycisphaerales bacterium]
MKLGRAIVAGAAIIGAVLLILSAGCGTYRDNTSELWDQRVEDGRPG